MTEALVPLNAYQANITGIFKGQGRNNSRADMGDDHAYYRGTASGRAQFASL
ncbi:hypothetical protein AB9E29_12815 [Rhizobium leguminosarum]|uniref:hypothetical protein n=1 Tax=Rhizobium leguminosarum TaxID=384 RepID=UPI003F97B244